MAPQALQDHRHGLERRGPFSNPNIRVMPLLTFLISNREDKNLSSVKGLANNIIEHGEELFIYHSIADLVHIYE